jgi:hypothetical protein
MRICGKNDDTKNTNNYSIQYINETGFQYGNIIQFFEINRAIYLYVESFETSNILFNQSDAAVRDSMLFIVFTEKLKQRNKEYLLIQIF